MRILVADDELMSRRLLEKTMQRIGYEVTAVPNGQLAAAELCKPEGPRSALGLDHAGTGRPPDRSQGRNAFPGDSRRAYLSLESWRDHGTSGSRTDAGAPGEQVYGHLL